MITKAELRTSFRNMMGAKQLDSAAKRDRMFYQATVVSKGILLTSYLLDFVKSGLSLHSAIHSINLQRGLGKIASDQAKAGMKAFYAQDGEGPFKMSLGFLPGVIEPTGRELAVLGQLKEKPYDSAVLFGKPTLPQRIINWFRS